MDVVAMPPFFNPSAISLFVCFLRPASSRMTIASRIVLSLNW